MHVSGLVSTQGNGASVVQVTAVTQYQLCPDLLHLSNV